MKTHFDYFDIQVRKDLLYRASNDRPPFHRDIFLLRSSPLPKNKYFPSKKILIVQIFISFSFPVLLLLCRKKKFLQIFSSFFFRLKKI